MHVLIDALVLALSYVLSWYCYVRLGVMNNHPERGILPPATYMMALLYIVPGYLLLYYAFNLYASKRFQGRRLEFANIFFETAFFPLLMVGRFDVSIIPLFGELRVIFFAFIAGICNDTGILEREMLAKIFEERQQGGTI